MGYCDFIEQLPGSIICKNCGVIRKSSSTKYVRECPIIGAHIPKKPCKPCRGSQKNKVGTKMIDEVGQKPGTFERVYVLNLARRPDKFEAFQKRWPENDLIARPVRFNACDGKLCQAPSWWKQGNPAWGCYRSHLLILEKCLNDGVESYLVFEDDATFEKDFVEKFAQAYAQVPDNWGMLYLGGQHLMQGKKRPSPVAANVVSPYNVNRTHAFALRGKTMQVVYKHLSDTSAWKNGHHVDHHLGKLVMQQKHAVYAVSPWLVGQADGMSDINGREVPVRFWNGADTAGHTFQKNYTLATNFAAIIGLHRSGSSCLATCLKHLGLYLGTQFVGCEEEGGGEARQLRDICERHMKFPTTEIQHENHLQDKLTRFVTTKCKEAKTRNTLAGAKYPHLCAFAKMLPDICGDKLKLIHINRPLEQSIASMIRREGKRFPADKLEAVQRFLYQEKQDFLSKWPHLTIEYDDLIAKPRETLTIACEFLGLKPRDVIMDSVIEKVDARKRHF